MTIQHKCKFCSCPITLDIVDESMFKLEYWKSLAACNRCADFREVRRRLVETLIACSIELSRYAEFLKTTNGEKKRERLWSLIVAVTKKYASLVCAFYSVPSEWHESFAQEIMDKPSKTVMILSVYERSVARNYRL